MKRLLQLICPLLLVLILLLAHNLATQMQKQLRKTSDILYTPPADFLKISSLGNKGLFSDYLFLKVYTFYGGTLNRNSKPRIRNEEWEWMINVLHNATELDPFFLDPYYFANAFLVWEAGMVKESNLLLEKGSRKREWDQLLPFYVGFNCYYFLNDGLKAFRFLSEASRRSGGNQLYESLAARAAYNADKTEFAISYLEDRIRDAELHGRKAGVADIAKRLESMKAMREIELAAESYRKVFGRRPADIAELLEKKMLGSMPSDPYGGFFYMDSNGRVRTTSDMRSVKK